jgi:ATP-dependent Clp protease ATP-binding subunit ClpX
VLATGDPAATAAVTIIRLDSPVNGQRCSFCGKAFHRVAGITAAGDTRICVECVELCEEILTEEMEHPF